MFKNSSNFERGENMDNEKWLINPMIFYNPETGEELVEPMQFLNDSFIEKAELKEIGNAPSKIIELNCIDAETGEQLIEPMQFFDGPNFEYKGLLDINVKDDFHDETVIENPEDVNELLNVFSDKNKIENSQQKTFNKRALKPLMEGTKPTEMECVYYLLLKQRLICLYEKIYVYNGECYVPMYECDLYRLIMKHCEKFVSKAGNNRYIEGVASLLYKCPDITVMDENISNDLISFENGILNLKYEYEGLHRHSPDYLMLYHIKACYSNEPTPVFDKFLYDISGGDEELIKRILQVIGYMLTPDNSAKALFLFQGIGNSGKSILSEVIFQLFNSESTATLKVHNFGDRFSLSTLIGKSFCLSADLPSGYLSDKSVSIIKQVTGGDHIDVEEKFKSHQTFKCRAKMLFVTNHSFLTKEYDPAFESRIVCIPFAYAVDKNAQDRFLKEKLLREKNGIVFKAIQAYFDLRKNNYRFAGDYKVNENLEFFGSQEKDAFTVIENFIIQNFKEDVNGFVFGNDAYEIFQKTYGDLVDKKYFLENLYKLCEEFFGGTRNRTRKSSKENARWGVQGISWKENVF